MKKAARVLLALAATVIVCTPASAFATDNKTAGANKANEIFAVTRHSIKGVGGTVNYTTTAGRLILKSDSGDRTAQMFFVAYEKKGGSKAKRPLTFAFNGGPGSSSVWLHLGAIGPRRIRFNEDGSPLPPPACLVDNEFTWLEFTDVVFIDPVGTGYSRAEDEKKEREFFGYKNDIEAVGDFIRLYLTRYSRWPSPKFIAGESYGTTRAVGLIDYLQQKHGIDLNGIILISPVLDFNTIDFTQSNDLPYFLFLPAYTAAAWYHKKLPPAFPELESALSLAEGWAAGSYVSLLAKGDGLAPAQQEAAAKDLSTYAGVSQSYALSNNLRMPCGRFRKELLRDQKKIIGRMDARMTMPDSDSAGDTAGSDPSLERLAGAFAGAVNDYLRTELKFIDDTPYTYLNYAAGRSWDWKSGMQGSQGYISVSQALTDAIHLNNSFKVFIAAGYFDLATPCFASKYTVDHLGLAKNLRDNVRMHFYPAGHMMYTDLSCLKKLYADIAAFYRVEDKK